MFGAELFGNYIFDHVQSFNSWIEIQRQEALAAMVDIKRHLIRHSVEDVIHTLQSLPVRGDMIVELPIIKTINRISLARQTG